MCVCAYDIDARPQPYIVLGTCIIFCANKMSFGFYWSAAFVRCHACWCIWVEWDGQEAHDSLIFLSNISLYWIEQKSRFTDYCSKGGYCSKKIQWIWVLVEGHHIFGSLVMMINVMIDKGFFFTGRWLRRWWKNHYRHPTRISNTILSHAFAGVFCA